ncbi:MAG: substrate-binding domain-containing protein [Dehalococcoidia bacterium]
MAIHMAWLARLGRSEKGAKFQWALPCILLLAILLSACLNQQRSLVLATTTSTYDSGLLDFIIPPFEQAYNVKVRVIAAGTGQALALGRSGDVDALLVHAPEKEKTFVDEGYGVNRQYVMYNDFVIIGPEEDPAGIRGLNGAADAFAKIAETGYTFISRGDESGTHTKEKAIWQEAGLTPPEREGWYLSIGQGMGATLTTANEKRAYTLSDRGTYLSRSNIDLVILMEGDEILFNPYHVMGVSPEMFPNVQDELTNLFIQYLISPETQEMIAEFGVETFGQPLFIPVRLEEASTP